MSLKKFQVISGNPGSGKVADFFVLVPFCFGKNCRKSVATCYEMQKMATYMKSTANEDVVQRLNAWKFIWAVDDN